MTLKCHACSDCKVQWHTSTAGGVHENITICKRCWQRDYRVTIHIKFCLGSAHSAIISMNSMCTWLCWALYVSKAAVLYSFNCVLVQAQKQGGRQLTLQDTTVPLIVPFSTCTPAQKRVTVSTDITVRGAAAKATQLPAHLSEFEFTAAESGRSTPQVLDKCTGILQHNRDKSRYPSSRLARALEA